MPELPDVETFKRYLDATSLHKTIAEVDVRSERLVAGATPDELASTLRGHAFTSTRRHGKHLFALLDGGGALELHFGMTGELEAYQDSGREPEYAQAVFAFENGDHLALVMPRKLGELRLVDDVDAFVEEQALGPDALDDAFDADAFVRALSGRRGMIKSALMTQELLAGLGNVYSDEVLFQAGVHPRTKVTDLDEAKLRELYRTMRRVLRVVVDHRARPDELPDGYLTGRREEGAPCPRCDGEIRTIEVSGRTGYYCPDCQD